MGDRSAGAEHAAVKLPAANFCIRLDDLKIEHKFPLHKKIIGQKMPPEHFVFFDLPAGRAKFFFVLLPAVFWLQTLNAVTPTNVYEFRSLLARPGSLKWEADHRLNQERQELHRKRLAITDATNEQVPKAASADLINGTTPPVPAVAAPATAESHFGQSFIFACLFLGLGVLILRRKNRILFDEFNQRINPWATAPPVERAFPPQVLAEEKPFGEFLDRVNAGPPAAPAEPASPLNDFFARAKTRLAAQRQLLEQITRAPNDAVLKNLLGELYAAMVELKAEAVLPEVLPFWQAAAALEGLLKQLTEKIRNARPSTLRTVAGGLDLLENLCVSALPPESLLQHPLKFLVADDDAVTRQALSFALKKAFSQPDLAVDGDAAFIHATEEFYDVIFLDVLMPGLNGFELCAKIRGSQLNRETPVVFVTGQSDFESRAQSVLSGGNDLMGKPFLIFEVTVKALTLAWQARIKSATQKVSASPTRQVNPALAADAGGKIETLMVAAANGRPPQTCFSH